MSIPVRVTRRLLATIGILGSAAAVAWTPYGYGPYGPGSTPGAAASGSQAPGPVEQGGGQGAAPTPDYSPYGYGYWPNYAYPGSAAPGAEGYGPGMETQPPAYSPYGPGPGFSGMDRPGYGGPPGRLQISRQVTEDAYIIEVGLGGMKPEDVQVTAEGNWISIGRKESRQESREDSFDQGRGYARSWSFSSGSTSRRLALPPDADAEGMTREESADTVRIVIPRRRSPHL